MVAIKALKDTELFKTIKVGSHELSHKIVYAPTTRMRGLSNNVPSDLILQYYDERTKFPGSLVIVEATLVAPRTGLYEKVPGIWNQEQVDAWKKITDKVHANGSRISIQLWALGRVADPAYTKKAGYPLIAPSVAYSDENAKKAAEAAGNPVTELTEEEIEEIIEVDFVNAAKNAVAAGFDYVEVHGAHGYLVDTFMQCSANFRTDKYGGSIEKRARFALQIIDRLTQEIGADRLAIRISPWAHFQGIAAADGDISPVAQFGYFVGELEKRAKAGNRLAYLSVVEPRVDGNVSVALEKIEHDNSFIKSIWTGVVVKAGNYTYDAPEFKTALHDASDGKTLIAFSRFFTSNPDLVQRLHDGSELTPYNRDHFYANSNWGYNTYGSFGQEIKVDEEAEKKRLPAPIKAEA